MITLAPKVDIEVGTVTYTLESRRGTSGWTFAKNLGTDPEQARAELDSRRAFMVGMNPNTDVEFQVTATLVEVTEW